MTWVLYYGSKIKLPKALEEVKAGLAIAERLVQLDKTNAIWQQDLADYREAVHETRQGKKIDFFTDGEPRKTGPVHASISSARTEPQD